MRAKSIRPALLAACCAWLGSASVDAQAPKAPTAGYASEVAPVLARYCVSCHGPEKPKGGLNLAAFATEAAALKDLKSWEKVLDNVKSGAMPPDDRPQIPAGESTRLVQYLESLISKASCKVAQDPGRVTLRRLNREEYNNTIRDLVGIDFRPADDFPSDDVGYGFDNIGDVLSLPPLLHGEVPRRRRGDRRPAILADDEPRGPTRRGSRPTAIAKPGTGYADGETGLLADVVERRGRRRPRLHPVRQLPPPGPGLRPAGGQGPAQARVPGRRQARPGLRGEGGAGLPAVFEAKIPKIKMPVKLRRRLHQRRLVSRLPRPPNAATATWRSTGSRSSARSTACPTTCPSRTGRSSSAGRPP